MTWIYVVPSLLFCLILIGVMVAIACFGHWLVYRYVPHRDFVKHNDVAGFVLAIIGVVYAVLLSFVVVVVWQEFENSDATAQREASAAADMYRLSAAYPAPFRQLIRAELRRYTRLMIDDEWPAMRLGGASRAAKDLTGLLADELSSYKPGTSNQVQVQAVMLGSLRVFLDSRRQRLHDNETGIPRILWGVLIASGVITIGFVYLFGMENFRIQLLMTALLAAIIGLMFTLIVELDYPFRGDTSISPHSWLLVEDQLMR